MMTGGLPGLPDIIKNVIPVNTPQMRYEQNPVSMIFGNFKRERLAKAKAIEAEIAASSNATVNSNLNSIHSFMTFSSRCADTFHQYEHLRVMRDLEQKHITLLNQKLEIEIYKLQAEATTSGHEANISELDYKVRLKQYEELISEKLEG
jgi:hypothetical protein